MRHIVKPESEVAAFEAFRKEIAKQKEEKGPLGFCSRHEILGIISEEFHELQEAVESDDMDFFEEELIDLMIASFWGIASLKNKSLDW